MRFWSVFILVSAAAVLASPSVFACGVGVDDGAGAHPAPPDPATLVAQAARMEAIATSNDQTAGAMVARAEQFAARAGRLRLEARGLAEPERSELLAQASELDARGARAKAQAAQLRRQASQLRVSALELRERASKLLGGGRMRRLPAPVSASNA